MIPGIVASQIRPPVPSGPVDPFWENVTSLINMVDPSGSTALTDSKGVIWTRTADPVMSDLQSHYADASLRLQQASGFDGFTAPSGLIPDQAPFTIEGWIFYTDINGFQGTWNPLISQGGGIGAQDQCVGLYSGRLVWLRGAALPGGQKVPVGPTTLAINTWNHIEFGFDGTNVYGFVNGALDFTEPDTRGWVNTGQAVMIGRANVPGYETFRLGFKGFIGPTRITSGACRHTTSFTPPAAQYPVG